MNPTLSWLSDPEIFEVNRERAHSDHSYNTKGGNLRQSLNGICIQCKPKCIGWCCNYSTSSRIYATAVSDCTLPNVLRNFAILFLPHLRLCKEKRQLPFAIVSSCLIFILAYF